MEAGLRLTYKLSLMGTGCMWCLGLLADPAWFWWLVLSVWTALMLGHDPDQAYEWISGNTHDGSGVQVERPEAAATNGKALPPTRQGSEDTQRDA